MSHADPRPESQSSVQSSAEVDEVASPSQAQREIEAMAGLRSLLVPINGTLVTLGALSLATRLAQMSKGKVSAVYVIEVARHLPLEAELPDEIERSEQIFARAREALRERMSMIEFALLQARNAGATIVDEAVNIEADAIVLGISEKRHADDAPMGATAEFILNHAPCRVLLYRGPRDNPSALP
jgi:nucleotide-binding universal stress UspA family protein